jgi:peptidoglycan/xylan/chitin deacetylase (PgdA/CDA1 family)
MPQTYGTLEGGREVLLTFDDGPHPKLTPKLLDCLKAHKVTGLFFVLGERVAATGGKDIVKRAFEEGHRIGNHTYSHPDLRKLKESEVRDQLKRTEDLIAPWLGEHRLFRPPYGAHNATVDKVVRDLGYNMVLWSVDSEDWRADRKPTGWIDKSLEQIRKRGHSVFLCHDIHPTTVGNFNAFLEQVKTVPKCCFVGYDSNAPSRAGAAGAVGGGGL